MQLREGFKHVNALSKDAMYGVVCLCVLALTCCTTSAAVVEKSFTEKSSRGSQKVIQIREGFGVACKVGSQQGWLSYLVSDIGKPNVPLLNQRESAQLNHILKFVHPTTLRFVETSGAFYVFDWYRQGDLCNPDAPPAFVLNGACNEYYRPLDLFGTTAAPSCASLRRPWISGDKGTGSGSWSSYNDH
jgi:hypothetical protein